MFGISNTKCWPHAVLAPISRSYPSVWGTFLRVTQPSAARRRPTHCVGRKYQNPNTKSQINPKFQISKVLNFDHWYLVLICYLILWCLEFPTQSVECAAARLACI